MRVVVVGGVAGGASAATRARRRGILRVVGGFVDDFLDDGSGQQIHRLAPECVLVAPGGEILATVQTSQNCYACMLGGEDGRDLYLVTAQSSDKHEASSERTGRIETTRVSTAGAGWP